MRNRILIVLFAVSLPGAAWAQAAGTATNETNLESAGQFRNITSTGVTKPPGGGGAASEPRPSEATRKQQAIDRKIQNGICIGCN